MFHQTQVVRSHCPVAYSMPPEHDLDLKVSLLILVLLGTHEHCLSWLPIRMHTKGMSMAYCTFNHGACYNAVHDLTTSVKSDRPDLTGLTSPSIAHCVNAFCMFTWLNMNVDFELEQLRVPYMHVGLATWLSRNSLFFSHKVLALPLPGDVWHWLQLASYLLLGHSNVRTEPVVTTVLVSC